MRKLLNIVSRFGAIVSRILDARLPLSVWVDSATIALYKTHR